MRKYFNIFCEIILPIIIGVSLYKAVKIEIIEELMKNNEKISLLVSTYSILIGFIITSMAIFMTSNSKALINISKNGKMSFLAFYFFITLTSSLFFIGICIINVTPFLFKIIMTLSVSSIIQYIFVTLNIFYITLKSIYQEKLENDRQIKIILEMLEIIVKKLDALYKKN